MKKLIAMLLCILLAGSVFMVGCKSNEKKGETEQKTETKKLLVATNAEFEPWESLNSNKEIVGADIDIINAIAKKLNYNVEVKNMEFDSVVASIASGTCDVAISALTINQKRKLSVDFAEPYYEGAAQILITKNDDTLFTGTTKEALDEQLKGKSIGVCAGFTGVAYAKGDEEWGFKPIQDAKVKEYENISLAITALKAGDIQVIIMDDSAATEACAAKDNKDTVKLIDIDLTVESYGIALKKGNTELKEKIDGALKELKSSGELKKIFENWNIK